jgi:hypothetical protein
MEAAERTARETLQAAERDRAIEREKHVAAVQEREKEIERARAQLAFQSQVRLPGRVGEHGDARASGRANLVRAWGGRSPKGRSSFPPPS